MIIGVDYASVDGNDRPDFVKAKAAGLRFAYVRGAWGTWTDLDLVRDRDAAEAAGITLGAYLFLRFPEKGHPSPTPGDQVAAFVRAYGKRRPGELPPALDIEFPGRGIVDTGMPLTNVLAWLETAYRAMVTAYPCTMVYTSKRVWEEDLDNKPAGIVMDAPLWCKTPYLYGKNHAVALTSAGEYDDSKYTPVPWHGSAWIQQFQGDAVGFPGFTGTVDLNKFLPLFDGDYRDPKINWVHARAGGSVEAFQRKLGLLSDGVVGPQTFARLAV
jgi:GH25 family lysozyme M1 (1,4-beta-N-acetylmuramidase)